MTRGNAGIYQIWKVMCINCIILFFKCMAYTRLRQKWKHNYFSFLIFFLLLIFFYLSIFRISFNNILINNLCNSLLLMGTVYEFIFIYVCHYKFNREILDLEKSKYIQFANLFLPTNTSFVEIW